jgi:hypothetical protein
MTELVISRSQTEIAARLREQSKGFNFATNDLLEHLEYEYAKEFLKTDVTPERWAEIQVGRKPIREQMVEYMPFAWEKANNCRGLSACRSIQHYQNWLWLIGQDQLAVDIEHYEYYGKPQLIRICEFLGLDAQTWDDGVRTNTDG